MLAETPFWRRHRIAFVAATALTLAAALTLMFVTNSGPRVIIIEGAQTKVEPIEAIRAVPADYTPRPGQAVFIASAK